MTNYKVMSVFGAESYHNALVQHYNQERFIENIHPHLKFIFMEYVLMIQYHGIYCIKVIFSLYYGTTTVRNKTLLDYQPKRLACGCHVS